MDNVVPFNKADIRRNLAQYAEDARGTFASNTERAYKADGKVFDTWREENNIPPETLTSRDIARFVDDMGETKAPATVSRYVVSLSKGFQAAGLPDLAKEEPVKLALKRVRRAKGTRQKQAAPLNVNILERLAMVLTDSPADLRDISLLRLARDTLARRSELTALDLADFTHNSDGSGTVLIRQAKTDQEGEGSIQFVTRPTMEAITAYIEAVGITNGPLFRRFYKGGSLGERLDANRVPSIFKRLAKLVGVDPSDISGHSARVGMAQDLVERGADLPALMQAGRWKTSRMPARYTEHQAANRNAVAQFFGK